MNSQDIVGTIAFVAIMVLLLIGFKTIKMGSDIVKHSKRT